MNQATKEAMAEFSMDNEAEVYEITQKEDMELYKALHVLSKFAHSKKELEQIFFIPEANGLLMGITLIGFGKQIGPMH